MRAWVAVLALFLAAGCGSGGGSKPTPTTVLAPFRGIMRLRVTNLNFPLNSVYPVGFQCDGRKVATEVEDVTTGGQITIRNEKSVTIGTGSLGQGGWTTDACELPFSVANVPSAKFYELTVGSHHVTVTSRDAIVFELTATI